MRDLVWGEHRLELGSKTQIMGIINLTLDSFSGDGMYSQSTKDIDGRVLRKAEKMVREGADIIDVGGESTRPGARSVSAGQEIKRVIPAIEKLVKRIKVPISIDTCKAEVAKAALDAGASMVNSINGVKRGLKLSKLVSRYKVPIIIMHIKGTPRTMQKNPRYKSVILDIISDLKEQIGIARNAGIEEDKIIVDPGIGFGKTTFHNLSILKNLRRFKSLGKPIAIGTSRKSFIGSILSVGVGQRLMGTAASVSLAIANGAHIIRVHDVQAMAQVARVTDAIVKTGV